MAKVIMVQGTMSNVGKSLVCAGLCRIFRQNGLKTAPFKSQNMALNSFITRDGLEMGRAQVMQAEAAMTEPDVRMNPILLKPESEMGSQVIVNGKVLGRYHARDYFSMKKQLIPQILEAYHSLAAENDMIVVEGAGSPAEINLKADDIVNMGLAEMIDAPVLLVGDIDRGGVFAQLKGTVDLLEEDERRRIKGLIINKFRGDRTILDPGIRMLEEKCGKPVLGVLPYLKLSIDDEDSLSDRLSRHTGQGAVDIAVIRLPHISNFTDFNPFEQIEGVSLRYVSSVSQLGNPDLIILPGTKNTMYDLRWLRTGGMEASVRKAVSAGIPVIGICGGYQMLGMRIEDPVGAEEGGNMSGIGLLPVNTVFLPEKTRKQVSGSFRELGLAELFHSLDGLRYEGYEIHMGTSLSEAARGGLTDAERLHSQGGMTAVADGCRMNPERSAAWGNVFGSYVHGLFDSEGAAGAVVRDLAVRKGLDPGELHSSDARAFRESQYEILAEEIRKHLDMEAVCRIAGI